MSANKQTDILVDLIAYIQEKLDNVQTLGDEVRIAEIELELQLAVEELRQEQRMEKIEQNHRNQWHTEQEERRAEERGDFI